MASAGEFCSWCCMWIAVVGILFNAVLIALVYRDNYYLLAMNHKDKTAEQLGFAMIIFAAIIGMCLACIFLCFKPKSESLADESGGFPTPIGGDLTLNPE